MRSAKSEESGGLSSDFRGKKRVEIQESNQEKKGSPVPLRVNQNETGEEEGKGNAKVLRCWGLRGSSFIEAGCLFQERS